MTAIGKAFDELKRPPQTSTMASYAVSALPNSRGVLLGKDTAGRAALLVECSVGDVGRPAPIVLQSLEVRHDVACRVALPGQAVDERRLSMIRCTSDDREVAAYFVDLLDVVVALIPREPSRRELGAILLRLCEVFASLDAPPARDARAVWAELFVIAVASLPKVAASWWRVDPTETFDFASGGKRLEVKSYTREPRGHHFSLSQLQPPHGVHALVASVCVRPSAGGMTLRALLARVRELVDDSDIALKVERVVAAALGRNLVSELPAAFDFESALESLRVYQVEAVPRVETPVAPEVTDVRFRVAMDAGQGARAADAGRRFPAFVDVLPSR